MERLEGINITILGGLNETHFNDMITEKEITGGFMARCQLVFARERGKKNSLLRKPSKTFTVASLAEPLKKLKDMTGQFIVEEDAIQCYEDWYEHFRPEQSSDRTGSAMRVHDHILKVALLIACSRIATNGQVIEQVVKKTDMITSIRLCLESTARVETVTKGAGRSEMAQKQKALLTALLAAPGYKLSRQALLQRCHGDFDVHELNRMEETFTAAEIMKEVYMARVDGKKDAMYELTEKTIKEYEGK